MSIAPQNLLILEVFGGKSSLFPKMCSPPVKFHHFSTTENNNSSGKILEMPTNHPTNQPVPGTAGIKRQSSGPRPLRLSAAAAKTKPCVKPKLQKPSAPPAEGVSGHPGGRSGWFVFEGRAWEKLAPRKFREICQFIVDFVFKTQKHPRNTHLRKETSTQNIRWTLLSFLEQKN